MKIADLKFIKTIQNLNVRIQIVLTKSDKIEQNLLFDKCLAIGTQLKKFKNVEERVHAVSSTTGFGVNHLKYAMIEAFLKYPTRELKGKEENLIKYIEKNKTIPLHRRKSSLPNLEQRKKLIKMKRKNSSTLIFENNRNSINNNNNDSEGKILA